MLKFPLFELNLYSFAYKIHPLQVFKDHNISCMNLEHPVIDDVILKTKSKISLLCSKIMFPLILFEDYLHIPPPLPLCHGNRSREDCWLGC